MITVTIFIIVLGLQVYAGGLENSLSILVHRVQGSRSRSVADLSRNAIAANMMDIAYVGLPESLIDLHKACLQMRFLWGDEQAEIAHFLTATTDLVKSKTSKNRQLQLLQQRFSDFSKAKQAALEPLVTLILAQSPPEWVAKSRAYYDSLQGQLKAVIACALFQTVGSLGDTKQRRELRDAVRSYDERRKAFTIYVYDVLGLTSFESGLLVFGDLLRAYHRMDLQIVQLLSGPDKEKFTTSDLQYLLEVKKIAISGAIGWQDTQLSALFDCAGWTRYRDAANAFLDNLPRNAPSRASTLRNFVRLVQSFQQLLGTVKM